MPRRAADLHPEAELPKFASHTLTVKAAQKPPVNRDAPGFGRKAVLYATCFGNYNNPGVGTDLIGVLARNGVETEVAQPKCRGMPLLEQGRLAEVADNARFVADALGPWIDKGYDVIALVPSCALMLKFEWPLILPENRAVETLDLLRKSVIIPDFVGRKPTYATGLLSRVTFDISEYIAGLAKKEGLAP